MKKEDLKTGTEIQKKIELLDSSIRTLKNDSKLIRIEIFVTDHGNLAVRDKCPHYTEKANTNLGYLNQLYRDNVLRTLEDCKNELEKEFELLGK